MVINGIHMRNIIFELKINQILMLLSTGKLLNKSAQLLSVVRGLDY